jgi:hypothetical protein
MYLRCCRCHESTWIRSLVPGLVERAVACQDCGHEHDLDRVSELGETAKQQYDKANRFAEDNKVDLPTAYSVLLGLMSLEDARGVDSEKKNKHRREAAAKATPDLPPEPVPVRRPRAGLRKRPARPARPGQPERADSKSTVTIHVEREMAEQRKKLTWGQLALLLVLASLTVGLAGRHAYKTWREIVDEARNARASTAASEKATENAELKKQEEARETEQRSVNLQPTVERDARGRVTRVVGPSPTEVLQAYCEAVSDIHPREPLELTDASPPSPAERFGVFRDFSQLESDRAIRISRVDGKNRWAAGNGRRPIPTREAPAAARSIRSVTKDSSD